MSAIVLALGLAGVGATPFVVQSASASTAFDPVEPCDAGDTSCQSDPQTTVTVTTTLGTPTPTDQPETTITKTVTAPPKKTASPTPKKTKTSSAPASTQPPAPPTQNVQPPSQNVEPPPVTTSSSPPQEESIQIPSVAQTTPAPVTPSETQVASSEDVPVELRAAAPEFDQKALTQKLSIPALVLVLLALFAVLIFEGRLRRMAHAAAVRKAGPMAGPGAAVPPPGGGYPAGPGYASAGFAAPGYPGGTAYAPIISFVPVQTYPSGPVQYAPMYQEPGHPYPPQGYDQEPPVAPSEPPPVVLHPDEFDSFNHEPPAAEKEFRDPFEPLVPPAPPAPDIPPGGGAPLDEGHEHPLGAAAAAEPGDSEPWQQAPGSLFQPASRGAEGPRGAEGYDPPPYVPADGEAPYVPADGEATTVQPLPPRPEPDQGLGPTREMPEEKRRRFRHKKKDG
ncbi:hypothetical protein MF672_004730 [Actinomadura sp. ATCC 31491]|uniref:Uncharacterized protein n=1 Tax=Actinomadura luzonensis TaxID=2805427 RepID=A0ABT0FMD5_9ACTN|nr:hypothetical protein [Actinomadura luzonensis]MCK2213106.1 hypothetical protein [Actinomadura luzonensis]